MASAAGAINIVGRLIRSRFAKEMLYTPNMLRQDFVEANEVALYETVVDLREGEYHAGPAAVVRGVFQH